MRRFISLFFVFMLLIAVSMPCSAMTTEELDEMIRREAAGEPAVAQSEPVQDTAVEVPADSGAAEEISSPADIPASIDISVPAEDTQLSDISEAPQSADAAEPNPIYDVKLPKVFYDALALIKSDTLRNDVQYESMRWYFEGRRDKAASVIGHAIATENDFSLFRLGRFCLDTLPAAGPVDAQAEFLTGFMRGYSRSGILMFTTYGLKGYKAYPMSRGTPWLKVPSGATSAATDERVYVGKGVAFIPFAYGAKFKLDVTANGGHSLTLWKILPEGANVKSWPAGVWEKEITVRGDVNYQATVQ